MSKIRFTPEQVELFRNNPYTCRVSEKSISFTAAFKELFYKQRQEGKLVSEILSENGYPPEILGEDRVSGLCHTVNKQYGTYGYFTDKNTRVPSDIENLTDKQKIRLLQHDVEYLKQELEFLKKITSIKITKD